MKLLVTIDRDEDGVWIVEFSLISFTVALARAFTKVEAIANIREAIALCSEVRVYQGLPMTLSIRSKLILALKNTSQLPTS